MFLKSVFSVMDPAMDIEMAKYVIDNVGDRFCELVEQEKAAMSWVSPDSKSRFKLTTISYKETNLNLFITTCRLCHNKKLIILLYLLFVKYL